MDISRRYRKRKEKRLIRIVLFALVIALFVTALLTIISWVPFIRIKKVNVYGYSNVSVIENVAMETLKGRKWIIFPRNNFFIYDKNELQNILKNKEFGIADVKTDFPQTLSITFRTDIPVFLWCAENGMCYYINSAGLIFAQAPAFNASPLPLLTIQRAAAEKTIVGDNFLFSKSAEFLNELVQLLKKSQIEAKNIELLGKATDAVAPLFVSEAKLFMEGDWFLFVSASSTPNYIAMDTALLLEEKIKDNKTRLEYIDLRFPNKAFYKIK